MRELLCLLATLAVIFLFTPVQANDLDVFKQGLESRQEPAKRSAVQSGQGARQPLTVAACRNRYQSLLAARDAIRERTRTRREPDAQKNYRLVCADTRSLIGVNSKTISLLRQCRGMLRSENTIEEHVRGRSLLMNVVADCPR